MLQDSTTPKQYCPIGSQLVIEHTLNLLLSHSSYFQKIIVVLHPNDTHFKTLPLSSHPKIHTTTGGHTRAQSVRCGLDALKAFTVKPNDWVLTHDAARPCLRKEKLQHFIDTIINTEIIGGLLAIPVSDTLKYIKKNHAIETIKRDNIWQAQTPQMFRYQHLDQALGNITPEKNNVSDEASAIEQLGYQPKIILGDTLNLKITHPEDLTLAHCLMENHYANS